MAIISDCLPICNSSYLNVQKGQSYFMGAAIDTESGGCDFRIMNSGVTS